ncbi:MAG: hypothetical protein ABH851_03620 [Methanobacteriota archaeon]
MYKQAGEPSPIEESLESFCGQLKDPDRGVAARAVDHITALGPSAIPGIFGKIKSSINENSSQGFMAAADLIWSLVKIGDKSAVDGLGQYASAENEVGVRKFAEWAVKRLGGEEPTLEQAVVDVRSSGFFKPLLGALDLDLIGDREVVPFLTTTYDHHLRQQSEVAPFVRGTVAWALHNHLEQAGVEDKLRVISMTDPDESVKHIADEALEE